MQEMVWRVDAEDRAKDSGGNDSKDDEGVFGTTAKHSIPMGWVMLSFLSRLQHTGKTGDHSTNEDMKKTNTTMKWSPEAEGSIRQW